MRTLGEYQDMNKHFSKTDWKIINSALALYEAEIDQDYNKPALLRNIENCRKKVWEQIEKR